MSEDVAEDGQAKKKATKCDNCSKVELELRKAKAIIIKSKEAKQFLKAKKEAAALTNENKRLVATMDTLKKEMESMIAKYAESGKLKGTIDLLREQINELKRALETREAEAVEGKKQLNLISVDRDRNVEMLKFAQEDKNNLLAEKKNQIVKLEKSHESETQQWDATSKKQLAEIERLTADLSEMKSTYNVSLQQSEQLMKDVDMSRHTIGSLEQELKAKQESVDGLSGRLKQMEEQVAEAKAQNRADATTIQELRQQITDIGLESKVAEKKNVQLIKELKSQLSKVNSPMPTRHVQEAPQAAPEGVPVAPRKPAVSTQTRAQAQTNDDAIGAEMEMLLNRMTQIQEEKWDLEVQLRDAQVAVGELSAAVASGREIMRHWAMDRKVGGRRDAHRDSIASPARRGGVVPEALRIETIEKLEQVLEDALMENIQLKTDINVVATELQMFKTGKK